MPCCHFISDLTTPIYFQKIYIEKNATSLVLILCLSAINHKSVQTRRPSTKISLTKLIQGSKTNYFRFNSLQILLVILKLFLVSVGKTKYMWIPDGDGHLHLENLIAELPPNFKVKISDVTFYFYPAFTRNYVFNFTIHNVQDFLDLPSFDPHHRNFFIIHGWLNDFSSPINALIKKSLFEISKENIFVVDWSKLAKSNYITAKSSVKKVGEMVGELVKKIEVTFSRSTFMMVGHSLGAHVAGHAGASLKGNLDGILGLDPASVLFSDSHPEDRLDKTDAKTVHVIHTSTWGLQEPIGHADYFPNGGLNQPGCFLDMLDICAHSRSYLYYAESIQRGNYKAVKCASYLDFEGGKCAENEESLMGGSELDTK